MPMLVSNQDSIWVKAGVTTSFPRLSSNIEVDVVVLGGGIAGVTAAYKLAQAGLKVCVIEKNTISSGTTKGTTGKVTSQQGLFYKKLIDNHGLQKARVYAEAYARAVVEIGNVIEKERIGCDWQLEDNYVYTASSSKAKLFEEEASAAQQLGLPASYETSLDLPFEVVAAVRFDRQAKFNAYSYTTELAKRIEAIGGLVYEDSEARKVLDSSGVIVLTRRGSVKAKYAIIATKIPPAPLLARFTYAGIVYPHTSYLVAAPSDYSLNGMYISVDKQHYSLMNTSLDGRNMLLVGGENHIPGLGLPARRYKKLEKYARKYFGAGSVTHRWKAMDYIAYDEIPVVGPLYPRSKNMFAITGFKKWGLSTSMVAANVILSLVSEDKNELTELLHSYRSSIFRSIPSKVIGR